MSLTLNLGLGVVIPVDDAGVILSLASEEPEEVDWVEDDEEDEGLYEFFENLDKKYPLLSFEYAYSEDYILGAAVFVKRLTASGYYEPAVLDSELFATEQEYDQLKAACEELKIDLDVKIIALPSYG